MPLTSEQRAELDAQKTERHQTRRATVPALEGKLFELIPVLDHGFVRLIDYMGDDSAIVQAARVSYGQGTKAARDDRGLIRYLMRHAHSTPFEMCEIKLHVKLPIFVARQWIRHRTANVNEISARYSILDREVYLPNPEQMAAQSATNRQGRGATLAADDARRVFAVLKDDAARAFDHYDWMLGAGKESPLNDPVAREIARINLPLNTYTQWYWKVDLHNLLHFIALRADPHAQYEIRVYADAIASLVEEWTPYAWEAFNDYRLTGARLSGPALAVVRRRLAGDVVDQESSGLSVGEWRELETLLKG